jgi:hypothetical protein
LCTGLGRAVAGRPDTAQQYFRLFSLATTHTSPYK